MGGTFDPPHNGHVFISKYAILRLNLKEVWWIVTFSNPFKKQSSSYKKRILFTKRFLRSTNIKLLEINKNDNKYAIDTIIYLKKNLNKKNLFG